MDEDSSVSVGDTDRFVAETTVVEAGSTNDLLLHRPFTKPEDQFIAGEVTPREQEGESVSGGVEMVVDSAPRPPTDESSGNPRPHQITEESGQSQMVPSTGFNGNDALQMVSKDWVLSQIDKAQESNSKKISTLEEKMTQMQIKFDQQVREKDEELQSKQRELDQCQAELSDCRKTIQDLEEKLAQEAEVRAEAEKERGDLQQKLEDCTKQLKKREKRARTLEDEVRRLTKCLEYADKASRTDEALESFQAVMTNFMREVSLTSPQATTPGTHQADPPSPTGFTFGLHPPAGKVKHSDKLVFSPRPSLDEPFWRSDEDKDSND